MGTGLRRYGRGGYRRNKSDELPNQDSSEFSFAAVIDIENRRDLLVGGELAAASLRQSLADRRPRRIVQLLGRGCPLSNDQQQLGRVIRSSCRQGAVSRPASSC
jgi:hypothetical protein